jgi:hypothetical protein
LNQTNYIKMSKEFKTIIENIEKSKKGLNEFIAQFNTLKFNYNKFGDTKASVVVVYQEFRKILAEYQDSLIGNKKYTFEFKESPIEYLFGRVFDYIVNFKLFQSFKCHYE